MKKTAKSLLLILLVCIMTVQLLPLGSFAFGASGIVPGAALKIDKNDSDWNTRDDKSGNELPTYNVAVQYKGEMLNGVQSVMITFDKTKLTFVPYTDNGYEFRSLVSEYEGMFKSNGDVEESFYQLKAQVGDGRGTSITDKWVPSGIVPVVSYAESGNFGFVYIIIKQEKIVNYNDYTTVCELRFAQSGNGEIDSSVIRFSTTSEANSLNASTAILMAASDGQTQEIYSYFDNGSGEISAPVYIINGNTTGGETVTPPADTDSDTSAPETNSPPAEAVQLYVPTNLNWSNKIATWSAVEGATGYIVQLYKNGVAFGAPVTSASTSCNFTSQITETGNYSFTVTAIGDGEVYLDSNASTLSGTNAFSSESDQDTLAVSAAVAGTLAGRRSCDNINSQSVKTAQVQKYVSETVASISQASGVLVNAEHKSGNIYTITFTKGKAIEEKDIEVIFEQTPSPEKQRVQKACDMLYEAGIESVIEGAMYSEKAIEDYIISHATALLSDKSLTVSYETVQTIAPIQGSENAVPQNGQIIFSYIVSDGTESVTSPRLSLEVLAPSHSAFTKAREAVWAAYGKILYCSGEFDLPASATPEMQDAAAFAYVNTLLKEVKAAYHVNVSLEKLDSDLYNVVFKQGEQMAECEMTVYVNYIPDASETEVEELYSNMGNSVNVDVITGSARDSIASAVVKKICGEDYQGRVWVSAVIGNETSAGCFDVEVTLSCDEYVKKKTITAYVTYITELSAPAPISFDFGRAVWTPVINADGYLVQLYKNGYPYGNTFTTTATEFDFSKMIFAKGNYTFKTVALGSGIYGTSAISDESTVYGYTQALNQIADDFAYVLNLPKTTYKVDITAGEGGTVDPAESQYVREGYNKTIVITPANGYKIEDVIVDGRSIGAVSMHIFYSVDGEHSIKVKFAKSSGIVLDEEDWENPFTDIKESSPYYNAIRFVNTNKLFYGTTTTTFGPEITMTRAMFVTVLGRLYGVDTSIYEGKKSFPDLVDGEYYCPYVEWASENEIIIGYDDGTFGPDNIINHQEMYVIIKRYADMIGKGAFSAQTVLRYSDTDKIHDWAVNSIKFCKALDLVEVGSEDAIDPLGKAKRCEVAMLLYRFCKNVLD